MDINEDVLLLIDIVKYMNTDIFCLYENAFSYDKLDNKIKITYEEKVIKNLKKNIFKKIDGNYNNKKVSKPKLSIKP